MAQRAHLYIFECPLFWHIIVGGGLRPTPYASTPYAYTPYTLRLHALNALNLDDDILARKRTDFVDAVIDALAAVHNLDPKLEIIELYRLALNSRSGEAVRYYIYI